MPNNDSPQTATPQLSTRGFVCDLVHVNRVMKMYAVQENELKSISSFNFDMTLWSSLCSMALAFAANCIWDLVTTDADFKTGIAILIGVLLFALFSVGMVVRYYYSKKNLIDNIQELTNIKE